MFNPLKYKAGSKVTVLGAGKSGLAAARLLKDKGFNVFVSDGGNTKAEGFEHETNVHSDRAFDAAFILKSPGISSNSPALIKANVKNIPLFSEAEVALAYMPKHTLCAVTGTNGKTTTTVLIGEILKNFAHGKAHVLGNGGVPFSEIKINAGDYIAGEFSSYQLEDSSYIKPKVSLILNITPDHIDHHGSYGRYVDAKIKIFKFQDSSDFCIFNMEDPSYSPLSYLCPSRSLCFSSKDKSADAFTDNGKIVIDFTGVAQYFDPPKLAGVHNLENAMAAALCALCLEVPAAVIQKTFDNFKGVEHRIEYVATVKGIEFYNDSKSTNVESAVTALKALGKQKNIWLVLGGCHKGYSYEPLLPLINRYVKTVFAVGDAAKDILKDLRGKADIDNCGTIECAVEQALEKGEEGDIFLFSPACSSFDRFKNFEERGKFFKKLIRSKKI